VTLILYCPINVVITLQKLLATCQTIVTSSLYPVMSNCLNYPLIASALEQLVVNVYIIIKLFVKSFKQAMGTPNIVKTKHVCKNRVHNLNKGNQSGTNLFLD
jgi:hypothetical protein